MYYRIERQQNILQISDNFASLLNIHHDGSLTFEFRYTVSQSAVITQKAVTVDVSIFTRTVKKPPILSPTKIGNLNSREVIGNILSDMSSAKSALISRENYTIQSRKSDISSKINNESIGEFKRGTPPSQIQQLYSSKIKQIPAGVLRQSNDPKPILDNQDLKVENMSLKVSSSIADDTRRLSHDLILRRGIDPSSISGIAPKFTHATESFLGTLRPSTSSELEEGTLMRLHDHVTLKQGINNVDTTSIKTDDQRLVNVVVSEAQDDIDMPVLLTFFPPKQKMGSKESSDVFVKFQLLDPKTGASIDTVIRPLEISNHINLFRTPTVAPIVKQARSQITSRANLEIRQISDNANEVHVYKKTLYVADVHIDDYTLVGVFPCKAAQNIFVPVDLPERSAILYRVIPAYNGIRGNCFTNIVVKPKKYTPVRALSLTSKITENGIIVEARKLPPDVISIQFLQRNLTIHEKEFTSIGAPYLIDDAARNSDHLSCTYQSAQNNNVYEFAVRLFHHDGVQIVTAVEILEYVAATPGKVDINVSNIAVTHDKTPNVTFTVGIKQLDTNLDVVKNLLENQGIKVYFEDDIQRQREQLKSLLAYSIHRIDLNTGDREDMGVITGESFSDIAVRKNFSSQELKYGHKYRYVITAVTRTPETTFDKFTKTSVDSITKKEYTFSPAKFLHPVALSRGLLVTGAGLKTLYAKSTMEHGTIGVSTEVEISFDDPYVQIIESTAGKFDHYHNVVSWKFQGDISAIDHFVIMKEINGMRMVLGTAHNVFSHGTAQWMHQLTGRDIGEIKYVITPVFSDFKHGLPVYTNSIVVGGI